MLSATQRATGALIAVTLLAAMLLAARSSTLPLLDPDEARFARTSVEMLRSGDPIVPRFQGKERLVKPPLVHWVQSSAFRVFGVGSFGARLHAILATLASILLTAWVARRRFGPHGAPWAAAVMATTPLVFVLGRVGTIDALLALHVTAALALDLAAPDDERSPLRAAAIGALIGLAFCAKGPVGVVLPCVMILAGRAGAGRRVLPRSPSLAQAAAGWSIVALPWLMAFVGRVGVERAVGVVRQEFVERAVSGTVHVEPAWYYLAIVPLAFLPWSAPLLSALLRTWRMRDDPRARTARYVATALIAAIVLLSLGRGKLPSYLLPLAPLVAWLVTWELARQLERARSAAPLGAHLLAATLAALAAAAWLGLRQVDEGPVASALPAIATSLSLATGLGAFGAWGRRPALVFASAAGSMAVVFGLVIGLVAPELARGRSAQPLVEAVPQLRDVRSLATLEIKVPSLSFYLDRPIDVLEMRELEGWLTAVESGVLASPALLVIAAPDVPDLTRGSASRLGEVGRAGKFRVFEPAPGLDP